MKPLTKAEKSLNNFLKAKGFLIFGNKKQFLYEFFSTVLNKPRNYKHLLYTEINDDEDFERFYRIKNSEQFDHFFEDDY